MKIAFAHYSTKSDISGVTTWLIGFCEWLLKEGHEVVIHLHHFGKDTQQGSILPSLQRLGIKTHSLPRTGSLEADTRHTLQFLNQEQPDLFLPQCLHAHYVAAAHAGRQGLPWIFTMHSDDPDYWCVAEALPPESHGGSSVCVSQFLAQQMRQRLPATNALVIPCGITLPAIQASFSEKPFRVVYSGRMVIHQKCIQQVIHTMIHACRASSHIEAHLIGDGPARSTCEQLAAQAGLTDRIHFYGRVPNERVQTLLQLSQAILLMSDFEGLPVALLEAMAAGVVPVVRSIESGIPELVQHERTGLLVENDSAKAAAALVRLSRDPDLWRHCSTQARALVHAGYGAEHCFDRWFEVIQRTKGTATVQFPMGIANLRRLIPEGDHRFLAQYPTTGMLLNKWHPRRVASALKRRIWT